MNNSDKNTNNYEALTCKNTAILGYWTGGWVLTMALATFGPRFIWDYNQWLTIAGIVGNLLIGFGMINANIRHLKGLDEMQRKIFLDAAALSLGVATVVGLSYEMLNNTHLISFEPRISHLVFLIGITFGAGMLWGHRRFQ